jgi:uncharacterized protein (TIGR02145 family)
MRKLILVLFAGMTLIGCQKDSGSNNNNNNNTASGTSHSCGATNVHNPNKTYGTVKDVEGNTYKTIQIGSQTWMAENLRTTKFRNGVSIPNITDNSQWQNNTTGAFTSYNSNTNNDCPYGKLYNWYAVANTNQLCPTGWDVPTDAEWNVLIANLDPAYNPTVVNSSQSAVAGGILKSIGTQYWQSPNNEATNSSGFSALPGGYLFNGSFLFIGSVCTWWTSTEYDANNALNRGGNWNNGRVVRNSIPKTVGMSVRCLQKVKSASITSLNCSSIQNNGVLTAGSPANNVNSLIPYIEGNGGSYSAQTINSTGVTGLIATLAAGNLVNGNGTLTYTITGTPSKSGTASFALSVGGQNCTFSRSVNANTNSGSVTDASGNIYPTITIGSQVWMKENLRTTKYSDGSNIPFVPDNTQWSNNWKNRASLPMMCWYNNDQATYAANKFGALYNWFAINPTTNGNKNLCPTGWHVPSDAEWNILIAYLDPSYNPNGQGTQSTIAGGMMKSTGAQYWQPNYSASNTSGFSGLPGGYRYYFDGVFDFQNIRGNWWSSSESSNSSAWVRNMQNVSGYIFRNGSEKEIAFSVRCIKN